MGISGWNILDPMRTFRGAQELDYTPEQTNVPDEAKQIGDQSTSTFDAMGQDRQNKEAPGGRWSIAAKTDAASANASQMDAAQAREVNMRLGPQGESRAQQQNLILALQRRAAGESPSVAEMQMRAGQDRAQKSAMSMAASQAGVNPALALRGAQNANEQMQMDTNQQAAVLRAQEQTQAEQAMGGALQNMRGQDIGLAQSEADLTQRGLQFNAGLSQQSNLTNAQLSQQAALANAGWQQEAGMFNATATNQVNANMLDANMQQRALNDQMTQYYMSQGFSRDQAQQQAALGGAALQQQSDLAQQQAEMQIALAEAGYETHQTDQQAATAGAIFGAIYGGPAGSKAGAEAGGAAANSDRRVKRNIKGSEREIDRFLDVLKSHKWNYKESRMGTGKHYGIMAQDLEKSDVGKSFVEDSADGKILNIKHGFGPVLAALGRISERQQQIESELSKIRSK